MTIELNGNGDNQRALVFCSSTDLTYKAGGYVLENMDGIGDGSIIIVADERKRVLIVYQGVGLDWGDGHA